MKYLSLLGVFVLLACQETKPTEENVSWKTEVAAIMKEQENSWNKADLESFMNPYLQSDSLIFLGSSGVTQGWNQSLANYKRSYPSPEKMGTLKFENIIFKKLNEQNVLVIGKWNLFRSSDTLKGHYSLNWQLINGEWKIITDHSS